VRYRRIFIPGKNHAQLGVTSVREEFAKHTQTEKKFFFAKKSILIHRHGKGNDISRYSNFLSYRVELSPIQVTLSVDLKIKAVK
jgi:hypothetical protein